MDFGTQQGDLADHIRYWGNSWILKRARAELTAYYPTIDGKPTTAYLWARTVPCQDPKCGVAVPLLKTLWLCKKASKRRALRLKTDSETRSIEFEVWKPGPKDEVPAGTMSGAKSRCPVCGSLLTPDYIKECGNAGKMSAQITTVVIDTENGKEYRPPTLMEEAIQQAAESLPGAAAHTSRWFADAAGLQAKNPRTLIVQLYGLNTWADLFTKRQLLTLATLVSGQDRLIRTDEAAGYESSCPLE